MRVALGLVVREVLHRKVSFLLSVVGVTAAVLIAVGLAMINDASQRETRRVTRDLGFNVRIIPKQTDMDRFWMDGFADQTMPASTVDRLVKRTDISYNHLLATLQQRIALSGQDVILTGLSDELFPPGHKKPLMVRPIPPGQAHVGSQVAERLGLHAGVHLNLGHAVDVVLDGIFNRDDVLGSGGDQSPDGRVKCRRLAAAGGAG